MLRRTLRTSLALALFLAPAACEVLEDQSPEQVSFRLQGPAGGVVQAVYSTEFVAGVTEDGITQIRLFGSDTVMQTLPIDTIVDIQQNRQFFVEILTVDTVDVAVDVEIDGRGVLDDSGKLFPTLPWRYVYQFNQLLTDAVEVIL